MEVAQQVTRGRGRVDRRAVAGAVAAEQGASGRPDHRRGIALLAALMIGFSVTPAVNALRSTEKNKDYSLWYRVGIEARTDADIYPTTNRPFPFMYPPSFAAFLGGASLLGWHGFMLAFLAANSAAWAACIMLTVELCTGRATGQRGYLYAVPSACVLPLIHDTYLLGQPALVLLALMLGAFACLRRGRDVAAGALIAAAAAIKAFPVLAVAYLVYRRKWRATAALVGVLAASLLVLPLAFRPPGRVASDLSVWTRGMVLKYDEGQIAQRPDRSFSFKNQSMVAVANRLLREVPADGEAKDGWHVNFAALDFRTLNLILVSASGALGLFYVAAMSRGDALDWRVQSIEQSMLITLITVASPLSFNYSFLWLMFPLALVLRMAMEAPAGTRREEVLLGWFLAMVAALALAIPLLRTAQAYGNLFFVALSLILGLGLVLLRRSPALDGLGPTSARA